MDNYNELKEKWVDRSDDRDWFYNLFDARQNVFMHGPNAVGKSSFINDVIKMYNFDSHGSEFFDVAVDCVEYYSEKLIAINISNSLNTRIRARAKKILDTKTHKGKVTLYGVNIPKIKFKAF